MAIILIVGGFFALVIGAESLVRGASRIATTFGMSPLVVGLTVVAFGTSAPELAISIGSALTGNVDLAVGNVAGSNIFNILLILGLSAVVTPLAVDQKLIKFDVPLVIASSLLVLYFASDLQISRIEGIALFSGLVLYITYCVIKGKSESPEIAAEYEEAFGEPAERKSSKTPSGKLKQTALDLVYIVIGLLLLVFGSDWLVTGATLIAESLGVSQLIIGLTIVAVGTSLPELATSVVAAARGERDIAVGNAVGSNLFNLLGVLGVSAAIAPDGIRVAEQALKFDLPVMTLAAVACLPICFTGKVISRWEGIFFFSSYVAYIAYLVLTAAG